MDIYKQIEKYNQIYKILKNYRIKKYNQIYKMLKNYRIKKEELKWD